MKNYMSKDGILFQTDSPTEGVKEVSSAQVKKIEKQISDHNAKTNKKIDESIRAYKAKKVDDLTNAISSGDKLAIKEVVNSIL